MNGSITEVIKQLKSNHDLNENAYKRFKQHVFWFVYFLPSVVGTLILWEFAKSPSLKGLLAVGLIIALHVKIKNHMYQTAQLYTVGEKTEGKLLKGSYYYHKTGFHAVCAFKTPHDNKQHKLTTIFHDYWAGNVWKIQLVDNEEKILREEAQKSSFSCPKYVQLLIGKKIHILYLPSKLPKSSSFRGFSRAVWSFLSIKPSGFTLYCSDVAKCYCLSKQRYAQHLSTIELRANTDKASEFL